jgi:hypothetical protein
MRTQLTLVLPDEQYMLLLNKGQVPFNGVSESGFLGLLVISLGTICFGGVLLFVLLVPPILPFLRRHI